MKLGVRTPNLKKSFKARTTGKIKRTIKSTYNPTYGKKGMGIINDSKKAVYNKVYNKTTVDSLDPIKKNKKKKKYSTKGKTVAQILSENTVILYLLGIISIIFGIFTTGILIGVIFILLGVCLITFSNNL